MTEYAVQSEKRGGVDIYRLSQGDEARVEIAPEWGNNCFLFHWRGQPVIEEVPFDALAKKPTSYGVPILFPYPNRIRDGRFTFQGREYTLDPPRHGFVRDKPWKVLSSGASASDGAWLTCAFDARDYPDKILSQFPFPFTAEVRYRLREDCLTMETRAANEGDRDMPIGLGTHAYFTRPDHGSVTVPARKRWELLDSLPTGKRIGLDDRYDLRRAADVTKLELDDIYSDLTADPDGKVRCRLVDDDRKMATVVEFSAREFPEVVVYTAPAPRKAICIEPYTCTTDAFNLVGRGVDAETITLGAGKKTAWTMWVRLSRA